MIGRPLALSIEVAFFDRSRSASKIAQAFSTLRQPVHAADVQRIWAAAKREGRLPNIQRRFARPKARAA